MGWIAFFENFIQIACLLFAWALVILAFFILAVQLFVTLIEFKLTTLAGFVLIPFGLFGKTAFMAERVLGNVISSGIKVLVLAVIIGIGSTLFSQFTAGFGGQTPTIDDAMAVVLAALSLLGLGIFGPGIASGLVSGGPQLSAGTAVGTGLAVGGAALAAGGAAGLAVKGGTAALSRGATAVRGGAAAAGAASSAYSLGSMGQAGASGVASGLGGVARAAGSAASSPLRRAATRATESVKSSFSDGVKGGFGATGGSSTMGTVGSDATGDTSGSTASTAGPVPSRDGPPDWAKRMKHSQAMSHGVSTAAHAIRAGDSHGSGSSVNLSESDRT
jgi:type IV secretion system protein TrbL